MPLKSLNLFLKPRSVVIRLRNLLLRLLVGVRLEPTVIASLSSRFVPATRGSITVDAETLIAFKTLIYSFDPIRREVRSIHIGRWCFIGGGSTIAPGVTVGDGSIVGAGAVVLEDVPPRSVVGGNPARVLKRDVAAGPFGRLEGADATAHRLWHSA